MAVTLLSQLQALYNQDLSDLQGLLEDLQTFEARLTDENAKSPEEKREQSLKEQGTALEDKLVQFTKERNAKFQDLQTRAAMAKELQEQICKILSMEEFTAENLRACRHFSASGVEGIITLHQNVRERMQKVLEMDEKIIKQLRIELEAVKLELHRLQGASKSKSAYQSQSYKEARFIDKKK